MAKKINITDKLSFEENPVLVIGTLEVEVNAEAETVLKLMEVLSGDMGMKEIHEAMNLIFKPEDIKEICKLKKGNKKLSTNSLMGIVQAAMELIMGDEEQGE